MAKIQGKGTQDLVLSFVLDGEKAGLKLAREVSEHVLTAAIETLSEKGADVAPLEALKNELHGAGGGPRGRPALASIGDSRTYKAAPSWVKSALSLDDDDKYRVEVCEDANGPYLAVRRAGMPTVPAAPKGSTVKRVRVKSKSDATEAQPSA